MIEDPHELARGVFQAVYPFSDPVRMTRKQASRWLLAVLVLTFILYAPSLRNTFTLDDRVIAMAVRDSGEPNPMVAELQPLGRYFTTNYWNTASAADVLYRPLTVLSYALVYTCLGRHLEGESGEASHNTC